MERPEAEINSLAPDQLRMKHSIKNCGIGLTLLATACSLLASERLNYTVYFWKIPCAAITMSLGEGSNINERELKFTTKTARVFSFIFEVDNSYTTVYDTQTFQMLRYEKKIKQPNIEQELSLQWDSDLGVYRYEDSHYERPSDTHNLFSFLMRGRATDWEDLDTRWWKLDHEGQLFQGRFLWVDSTEIDMNGESYLSDHYRFDLRRIGDSGTELLEKTDVFTWGIVLDNCVRQIWVGRGGERRILRAEVTVKGITLTVEIEDD